MAAISCGIYKGEVILDLDYEEDSNASADANFVMTGSGGLIELQATAESEPFAPSVFEKMMTLAHHGVSEIIQFQQVALASS